MLLATVVETSRRIAETTKRLEKIDLLVRLLKQLRPDETEIAVAYLSGSTRQGRIGAGYGALRDASATPADSPSLELVEIDRAFESLMATQGPGSVQRRSGLLRGLMARST